MRPENYSRCGNYSGISGWGASNFLEELDKRNVKTKVASILLDNDAPLEQQSRLLAKRINNIKDNKHCKKVRVLGLSKCGCMCVAMLKYLSDSNLDKLNIMAYSAPYLGTIFASPITLYDKIDDIADKAPSKLMKKVVYNLENIEPEKWNIGQRPNSIIEALKNIHWSFFSQSHMDYDISICDGNGIPDMHQNRYDENFLKGMFDEKTLDMLKRVNFTNITTYCSQDTLQDALETFNITEGMLYLSSKFVFGQELSDGMVSLKSAKYIEEVCKKNGIHVSSLNVLSGHHDLASDTRLIRCIVNSKEFNTDFKIQDEVDR